MTNRRKAVIRILLFIAKLVNDEPEIVKDLETLITHLNVLSDK